MRLGDTVLVDDGSSKRRRRYTIGDLNEKYVIVEDRAGVQTFLPREETERQIKAQRLAKQRKGRSREGKSVWMLFVPWGGQPRPRK